MKYIDVVSTIFSVLAQSVLSIGSPFLTYVLLKGVFTMMFAHSLLLLLAVMPVG